MIREKRILSYFICWALVGYIIFLIGTSNVFALTNKTIYSGVNSSGLTGGGYYNYGYINAGGVQNTTTGAVGSTINGISYGFQFYYYEDIILNNTYTLKINFKDNDLLKSVNSNYFDIQTCNNDNCNNAIIISLEKSNQNSNSNWAIVKFNPVSIGNIVSITIGTNDNKPITGIQTFGISSIQTEYSNANQDIIDNNNDNTNNIIDNNNNNTQNIIDNQDKNTQDIINSNLVCDTYNNTNIKENGFLDINGTLTSNSSWGITDYIPITSINTLKIIHNLTYSSGTSYCFYKNSKTLISCYKSTEQEINKSLEIPANTSFVRFSIEKGLDLPTFAICKNGSQATNDKLDDLNSTLTDSSPTDMSGLGDSAGWLPPGPVDSILNLPLTFFLNLSESLGSECRTVELTLPFVNKKIYLPCIRTLYDKMGVTGTIFTTAGVIASAVILFNYLLALYKWVDDTLTLRENTMPGYYEDKWGGGA